MHREHEGGSPSPEDLFAADAAQANGCGQVSGGIRGLLRLGGHPGAGALDSTSIRRRARRQPTGFSDLHHPAGPPTWCAGCARDVRAHARAHRGAHEDQPASSHRSTDPLDRANRVHFGRSRDRGQPEEPGLTDPTRPRRSQGLDPSQHHSGRHSARVAKPRRQPDLHRHALLAHREIWGPGRDSCVRLASSALAGAPPAGARRR